MNTGINVNQIKWEDRNRAVNAAMESHSNADLRAILRINAWKVREGSWTFREWKKHAQNMTYGKGPFCAPFRLR